MIDDHLLDTGIAIVGMAGRFPGSVDVDSYWDNVRNGVECIRTLSDEELLRAGVPASVLRDPDYVKAAGVLDDVPMFDAGFFGVSPKDAAIMDPQHRHLLECAVTALEHAGHAPRSFDGSIGVFAGCGVNAYFMNNVLTNPALVKDVGFFLLRHTGNDRDFLPTTISYKLDLRGPSMAVQTACSTSLVAVHAACQSLLSGECDMALAGGATILVPHGHGYYYRENEPVSPDGHCRPFSSDSAGTVVSSGVGMVALRRLADALDSGDTIHAVIRGSAVNNDGASKIGYLAPSVDGHARVVTEALAVAGVDADSIDYIEAHGTATPVGDPVEVAALTQAFRQSTEREQFCRIGSVKGNIGHLDTAAGVASLIKVTRALAAREMPPSLHFAGPNPDIPFATSPFTVNAELRSWPESATPRRGGVSSLGIGGTNAHVVLEEAPKARPSEPPARAAQLLVLSAKSKTALATMRSNLAAWLRANPEASLADVAYTLQQGRESWDFRCVVAASDPMEAAVALEEEQSLCSFSGKREGTANGVVFMFSGAGSQYPDMCRGLHESEPVFRAAMDECLEIIGRVSGHDLETVLYPSLEARDAAGRELERPSRLLPAVFATEWSLVQLWRSWGVEPEAMIGHSLGEYVAACVAGVMSLEDALRMVLLRGELIDTLSGGAMLSLACSEAEARAAIGTEFDLGLINSPGLCVVSGSHDAVVALQQRLGADGIEGRLIPVSAAGHSRHLDPILGRFRDGIGRITLRPPELPYVSNVTGTWVTPEDAVNPDYWVRHLRDTVRFSDGLATLMERPDRVLLEVGPGQTLCSFSRQQPVKARGIVPTVRRATDGVDDLHAALVAFGRLWVAGATPDWSRLRGEEHRRRIPLPTYPFEHKPYWIEPGRGQGAVEDAEPLLERLDTVGSWLRRRVWRQAPVDVATDLQAPATWLLFLDDAGVGMQLAEHLRSGGHKLVTVVPGDAFHRFDETSYALAPESGRGGYDDLVAALAADDLMPERVLHMWGLTASERFRPGSSFLHRNQEYGFFSLLFLMQALGDAEASLPEDLTVVVNGVQAVREGDALPYPDKATMLGPVRVIPREFPGVACRCVDVELPSVQPRGWLARLRSTDEAGDDGLDLLVSNLAHELGAPTRCDSIAWRGTARYEETRAPIGPASASRREVRFTSPGVYLVTGGLGGIGFALAEQIARRDRVQMVLIGRTGFPPEAHWDAWLESHGEQDETAIRIRTIRSVREAGGDLHVVAADVADAQAMDAALRGIRTSLGPIRGVIHAAGGADDGVIQAKSRDSVERVFASKLHGTLMLERLLADDPLDFMVLFSSSSALLGPPGQVDYVAANAFLDAFAERRNRAGAFTLAIGWGVWKEVGAAKAMARRLRGEPEQHRLVRHTRHPMLGDCVVDGPELWRWIADWSVDQLWVLDDHRNAAGDAILPGTAGLELARAAFRDALGIDAVDIRDLSFLAPLTVPDQQARRIEMRLARKGASYAFEILDPATGTTHVSARLTPLISRAAEPLRIEALAERCRVSEERAVEGSALQSSQEAQLGFGPRWQNLRASRFGRTEALLELSLDPPFVSDLDAYALHPALMDVATGAGLPLVDGWRAGASLYVPFSYDRVLVRGPLTGDLRSWIRNVQDDSADENTAIFDIVIADAGGRVLVEVSGYRMRGLDVTAGFGAASASTVRGAPAPVPSPAERLFLETWDAGIRVEEGLEALQRCFDARSGGAVLSIPLDLGVWRQRLDSLSREQDASSALKFARPELESSYEGPRGPLEEQLIGFWEELLGVDRIGIHDDFFELGGHSLIAVRLFARIKKTFGADSPISVLFEAPTVALLAEHLERMGVALERGEAGDDARGPGAAGPAAPALRYLVSMSPGADASATPFFVVAGMFGNVLNLRPLAVHLGLDRPVYALQARGLHGEDEPHVRFEDMAREYIAEMRQAQPSGPYLVGGFSGGGVTAWEIARQLLAAGEEVAALVLLDAIPPHPAWPEPTQRDFLHIHWLRFRRQGPRYAWNWLRDRVQWELQKRRRSAPEQVSRTPAEFRSELIEAGFREALGHYEMRTYPGRVHLFRPPLDIVYDLGNGRYANRTRQLIESENWWTPWVLGGLEVDEVPGNHDSMVLEPNVRVLAGKVRKVLAEMDHQAVVEDIRARAPRRSDGDARAPVESDSSGARGRTGR